MVSPHTVHVVKLLLGAGMAMIAMWTIGIMVESLATAMAYAFTAIIIGGLLVWVMKASP